MTAEPSLQGAFYVWLWNDQALENPNQLKNALDAILDHGFSGVLARLNQTRYPLTHARVVRAVTQVSLWAKNRGLPFWFQADPRQASRPLINQSQESAQTLFYNCPDSINTNAQPSRIKDNYFNLTFPYPAFRKTSKMDDRALLFIPAALERAFMFRMKGGQIIKKTVRDISDSTNFFVNIPEQTIEVFGHINTMGEEDWHVMAFPKFHSNAFDYAGRVANDLLYDFVESLFDAGAFIDGITWNTAGYVTDIGRLPVSLSIYHSFMAEFSYDIRDFLYALIIDTDDAAHIRIRHHYHKLLMQAVYSAFKEFAAVSQSFLGSIESVTSHSWGFRDRPSLSLIQGDMDPWEGLKASTVGMTEMPVDQETIDNIPKLLSQLIATRSLAVYSKSSSAYLHLKIKTDVPWPWLIDLITFHSIHPAIDSEDAPIQGAAFQFENNFHSTIELINTRIQAIGKLTSFHLPAANTALVYPMDTLMAAGHEKADRIVNRFHQCAASLALLGLQIDIISPSLLLKGKVQKGCLRIGHRDYDQLLYPDPDVIQMDVFNALSVFKSQGIECHFGGSRPQYSIAGDRLPYRAQIHFDPENIHQDDLKKLNLSGLIQGLEHGMANIIPAGDASLLLFMPAHPQTAMHGSIQFRKCRFELPESNTLNIFKVTQQNKVTRLL